MELDAPTWEYRLGGWSADDRNALDALVHRARIPRSWLSSNLFVPSDRRAEVDALIAELSGAARAGARPPAPASPAARSTPPPPPPGWHPDPWQQAPWRWWDGTRWTGYVSVPSVPERSWIPPRGTRDLGIRGALIALLGVVAAVVLSLVGVLVVGWVTGSRRGLLALCLGQAGLWVGLLGACKLAVRRHGSGSLRELGLLRLSWRQLGSGTVASLVARFGSGVIAIALLQLFPNQPTGNTSGYATRLHQNPLDIVIVVFILVIGAPFVEELFFRGLVQGALTDRIGGRAALFAQAICFGLVHFQLGMTAAQFLIVFAMISFTGLVLGSVRWHYQRLGPGMIAHGLFNAVAVLVLFLA